MISKRIFVLQILFLYLSSGLAIAGDTRVIHADQVQLDSGAYHVTMSAGSLSGNTTFTPPVSNGTAGYVLRSDGAGISSWVDTLTTLHVADGSHNGYLSSSDWTTFSAATPSTRTISTTAPLTGGGALSGNLTLAIPAATGSINGYLTSTDWTTFNAKQTAITVGAIGAATTNGMTLSAGTLALGAADSTHGGAITSTDWNTFNNKVSTSRTISTTAPLTGGGALSGDLTLAIPAAAASTDGYVSSSGNQTFGGNKSFNGNLTVGTNLIYTVTADSTTTGSNASLAHPTTFIRLTNASLSSIASLPKNSITTGHEVIVSNQTGNRITIVNNYGSTPGTDAPILTATGADTTIPNNGALYLTYDSTVPAWYVTAVNRGVQQIADGGTGITTLGGANTVLHGGASVPAYSAVADADLTGQVGVAHGGTGIASGTSGGIPYFSGSTSIASSGALTANAVVVGGGAATTPAVVTNNSTGTNKFLTQSSSAMPAWATISSGDVPSLDASKITSGTLAVAQGGTNLASGTSGGILGYTASGTLASSAALTANGVVLGGGAGATPTSTSAGSAYQPLRVPSGGGAPAFGALDISQSAAVTGALAITNGGTGQTTANAALNALLPTQTGNGGKLLSTDGSNTSWASAASSTLNQYNTDIGDASNVRTATNTNLLGDNKAFTGSSTVTITIASPGVVSFTSHGRVTGDKVYLTTTGALPTGLTASTTYYVIYVDANSFQLATSLSNAAAGTAINTSGSQSGTHTLFYGGVITNNECVQTVKQRASSAGISSNSATTVTSVAIPPGAWMISGQVGFQGGSTTSATFSKAFISTTNNGFPASNTDFSTTLAEIQTAQNATSDDWGLGIAPILVTISGNVSVTHYLVATATFTGSLAAYGHITACRTLH